MHQTKRHWIVLIVSSPRWICSANMMQFALQLWRKKSQRGAAYLWHPVVVCSLVGCELAIRGLLEWCDTPSLECIGGIGPHPFARPKYFAMVLEGPHASECPRIVHTAGVTQRVINDYKVVGQHDDLKWWCKSVLIPKRIVMYLAVNRIVFVFVEPHLSMLPGFLKKDKFCPISK